MSKVYLVTGANSGLGLEAVRKLAAREDTQKVYLACRSQNKALDAIDGLIENDKIPKSKLEYVHFDASASKEEIEKIVDVVNPLDGLILNAGGWGADKEGKPTGPNKVLDMYQINLVGHIQLVNILHQAKKLKPGARIVYSGSEAARGVPILMCGNPEMGDTAEWYTQRLTGVQPRNYNPMNTYATVKGVAALYWSAWARRHDDYHVLTVSPGSTAGTEIFGSEAIPAHFKTLLPMTMPVMKFTGIMHSLDIGTDRYICAVLGQGDMANMASGTFVASSWSWGATGAIAAQAQLKSGRKYGDRTKQEAAFEALSVYT